MIRFVKHYALEIYSVIAGALIVCAALMGDLSVIQKFVIVYTFLFILHEWEEARYPGGFIDLIASMLKMDVSEDMKRASRVPAGIFLLMFAVVPFIFHDNIFIVMMLAVFGCFEGFVHVMGIKVFGLKKFYTPGMVTAELELLTSVVLFFYLVNNDLGSWYDYTFAPFAFIPCFMTLQKCLTMMVGIRYRDLPKMIRARIKESK